MTSTNPGSRPSNGADAVVGTVLAERYKVLRQIGRGGMGVVYLAEHVLLEKRVAVKLLSEDFAKNPELVQRFLQEAKAASRIGHENIVDVVDCGLTPSGTAYFVMELLDGQDLATVIRAQGRLPVGRTRDIVLQICSALAAAHKKGIVHRDMKSENIFLCTRGGRDLVKILDFGIAKMQTIDADEPRLTRAGVVLGTPEYMAPEQAKGDRTDHRVDVYAVGCLLYEMVTGRPPFHAETVMGILAKQLFDEPEPPSHKTRSVPADLERVILKALAKRADERHQSMEEMAEALAACKDPAADAAEDKRRPGMRHPTKPGVGGDAQPPIAQAKAALDSGDFESALAAAERAIGMAGGLGSGELAPHRKLLEEIYGYPLGDQHDLVCIAELSHSLDPRAAFLLSRIDGTLSVRDVLDVSGMPRLEAMRLLTLLLREGTLELQPA